MIPRNQELTVSIENILILSFIYNESFYQRIQIEQERLWLVLQVKIWLLSLRRKNQKMKKQLHKYNIISNYLRCLALLLLITLLPALVDMRALKPWVLFLFRLLG